MQKELKEYGPNRNYINVIEMKTSLKWLPLVPIRAYSSEYVARKVIEDITGLGYIEALHCKDPKYRITSYLSENINEF